MMSTEEGSVIAASGNKLKTAFNVISILISIAALIIFFMILKHLGWNNLVKDISESFGKGNTDGAVAFVCILAIFHGGVPSLVPLIYKMLPLHLAMVSAIYALTRQNTKKEFALVLIIIFLLWITQCLIFKKIQKRKKEG